MSDKKELGDFMKKKSMQARGELEVDADDEEDKLSDAPKSVNQDAAMENIKAAKALTIFRMILNLLFIIPLVLAAISLVAYILLKFLPSMLFFIKRFIIILMQAN